MTKLQWLSATKQKYAVGWNTRCERCGRPHSVYIVNLNYAVFVSVN